MTVGDSLSRSLDAALDDADHSAIVRSRAEAAEQGGVEFESFFDGLAEDRA